MYTHILNNFNYLLLSVLPPSAILACQNSFLCGVFGRVMCTCVIICACVCKREREKEKEKERESKRRCLCEQERERESAKR